MRRPREILDAARSRWPALLRAEASGDSVFPLVIPFGRPSTTSDFGAIRGDLTSLAAADYGWQIDWEEISTRKWGNQRWPRRVSFDSIESLAQALESTEELRSFREALVLARLTCPKLNRGLRRERTGYRNCFLSGETLSAFALSLTRIPLQIVSSGNCRFLLGQSLSRNTQGYLANC